MFEKRFQKLVPRVSSGFPNTRKLMKALGLVLLSVLLVFGNPGETLALVIEILFKYLIHHQGKLYLMATATT